MPSSTRVRPRCGPGDQPKEFRAAGDDHPSTRCRCGLRLHRWLPHTHVASPDFPSPALSGPSLATSGPSPAGFAVCAGEVTPKCQVTSKVPKMPRGSR